MEGESKVIDKVDFYFCPYCNINFKSKKCPRCKRNGKPVKQPFERDMSKDPSYFDYVMKNNKGKGSSE